MCFHFLIKMSSEQKGVHVIKHAKHIYLQLLSVELKSIYFEANLSPTVTTTPVITLSTKEISTGNVRQYHLCLLKLQSVGSRGNLP